VTSLLRAGGFHIRKWMTNSEEVLDSIPQADRATAMNILVGGHGHCNLPSAKTLGVMWCATEDVFSFHYPSPVQLPTITKRSVLRKMASIFDPRGQIAPFTIRSRVLFQHACIGGYGWDDELDEAQQKRWQKWFSELPDLSAIKARRCFKLKDIDPEEASLQVHTFVDASDSAYAAVSYIRCSYPDGTVQTTLAMAKARPASIQKQSIPKLELRGAVQGVKVSREMERAINIPIESHVFWTDSMNVLYWIRSVSRHLKTDIATRVAEIQQSTSASQWRHVPGKVNPADKPTRGMSAEALATDDAWWNGPDFLRETEDSWPHRDIVVPSPLTGEVKKNRALCFVSAAQQPVATSRLDPERYSSWSRLFRVTAWCRRFIGSAGRKAQPVAEHVTSVHVGSGQRSVKVPELSPEEIEAAERFWFLVAQRDVYGDTLGRLRQEKEVTPQDPLRKLNPGLSAQEPRVLEVHGRLDASKLPASVRRPTILPQKHAVTQLIIGEADAKCGHEFGAGYVWSQLAERFWIVKGKSAIKMFQKKCNGCTRRHARPSQQLMGQLPASRVEGTTQAFSNVGVDYAGPLLTRQGRGKPRAKRYVCVFTCLETRACHLELAYSMTTDGFLMCFSRFQKRRGTPINMVSDNGSNFCSAESELRQAVRSLEQGKIASVLATQKISWKFNPPHAPHHGGVFEAVVKLAKRAISAVLRDAACSDEELHTALVEAENLVNSRPLTAISEDADDLSPLTPQHFLIGRCVMPVPLEVSADTEDRVHPERRWRVVQRLVRDIWRRWQKELVPLLNVRQRWWKAGRQLKVGDVVLHLEAGAPRGSWPLARVTKVYPGPDGKVRVVDVLMKGREYRRAISVLAPLECEAQPAEIQ